MGKMNYLKILFIFLFLGTLIIYLNEDKFLSKEKSEADNEKTTKAVLENSTVIENMPEIADIITGDGYAIVLCKDGSVWSQEKVQNTNQKIEWDINLFKKIEGLNKITKIMDAGSVKYALSSEGYIYAWGKNQLGIIRPDEERNKIFNQPVVIEGISNVKDMDAKNGKVFAIDKEGNFYAWGLELYKEDYNDVRPGFTKEGRKAVKNVKKIFMGAGEYHYFVREDEGIFSIMSSPMDLTYVDAFIFPDLTIVEKEPGTLFKEKYFEFDRPESSVRIDEGSKWGKTILYEMGNSDNISHIDADDYTMFILRTDGTLCYWNSERIKYHDYKIALADIDSKINYGGCFIEVDYAELLNSEKSDMKNPRIIDLCAGKENVLFLTDNGQVFMSKYITTEIKDVEYYNRASTKPDRTIFTGRLTNMHLKALSFQKLGYQNIIGVNTDGNFHFSLLDNEGNYYDLNMSSN